MEKSNKPNPNSEAFVLPNFNMLDEYDITKIFGDKDELEVYKKENITTTPGIKSAFIEVPHPNPAYVSVKSILTSEKFRNNRYKLPLIIGRTISNADVIVDLTKMPHLVIAAECRKDKSARLHAIISSLLFKKHPSELKLVLIDFSNTELSLYSRIDGHYLAKLYESEDAVISDTQMAVRTLKSLNIEMDNRYRLHGSALVRNIKLYNSKFTANKLNPRSGHHLMPYIVVVIDDFADLILAAGNEMELLVVRLAQLAHCVGIHLVIATHLCSLNIIKATIKAPINFAFQVISQDGSTTILNASFADKLINQGDHFLPQEKAIVRLHSAFISTQEVGRITEFIAAQSGYHKVHALPKFSEEETTPPK